jgi:hypothetical protein
VLAKKKERGHISFKKLGITQPRLNDLIRSITRFKLLATHLKGVLWKTPLDTSRYCNTAATPTYAKYSMGQPIGK